MQITSCFEKISCFGLTHPGFEVVKKNFKGEINKIQPSFLRLLNGYVRHIFGDLVSPRAQHGVVSLRIEREIEAAAKCFVPSHVTPIEWTFCWGGGGMERQTLRFSLFLIPLLVNASADGFLTAGGQEDKRA